jgi:hypothetical protein
MRAVIIGTDFIKDTNGSFKAIETNTNVGMDVNVGRHIDSGSFTSFVLDNSFQEIHLIYTFANLQITSIEDLLNTDANDNARQFNNFLKNVICVPNNIAFVPHSLDENSLTIPFIEDDATKLIIRLSYDTTALLDDEYARDNFSFLKLMYDTDENSVPKCYIADNDYQIDNIGEVLRDNGNHPNYCIKKRITPADNKIYPKLFKVNNIEELDILKSTLEVDEYIQEYIYSPAELIDDKIFHYRSIDLVYGALESMNLYSYKKTNILPIVDNCDFNDDNQVQIWDRPRYVSKVFNSQGDVSVRLDADETTRVVMSDNTIVTANNLNLNDSVKSIQFNIGNSNMMVENWSSSFSEVSESFSVTSSILVAKDSFDYFGKIINIELDNGSKFSDVPHGRVFKIVEETIVMYNYDQLKIGDMIVLIDNETNKIETKTIQNIEYSFESLTAYRIDVEQSDLFLSMEESEIEPKYAILTHNYDYDCRIRKCDSINAYYQEPSIVRGRDCYTGYISGASATYGACFRTNLNVQCTNFNNSVFYYTADFHAFCNGQKPSDMNLKKNIKYSHTLPRGLRIYTFEFIDEFVKVQKEKYDDDYSGKWQGVLAQDLLGTEFEECLNLREDTYFEVDYVKLNLELTKI